MADMSAGVCIQHYNDFDYRTLSSRVKSIINTVLHSRGAVTSNIEQNRL